MVKTDGAEVEPLEKLYAQLAQSIYRHRDNFNKTELIQVSADVTVLFHSSTGVNRRCLNRSYQQFVSTVTSGSVQINPSKMGK